MNCLSALFNTTEHSLEVDAFWARKITTSYEKMNACDPLYDRGKDPRYNLNLKPQLVNTNNDGRYRTPFIEFEGVRMSVEMKVDIEKVRAKIIESVR